MKHTSIDTTAVTAPAKPVQESEALIAALAIVAMGESDRLQGKGLSAAELRTQLLAARRDRDDLVC